MEDRMDELIRRLRNSTPSLNEPQRLTDRIMEQIDAQRSNPWLSAVRVVLSSAAVLLVGLFLMQHLEAEESGYAAASATPRMEQPTVDKDCLQASNSLYQNYLCHLKQHAIENETYHFYPQPKNEAHENL